jgi:4-carboxymuconolactone decarboxylase
MNRVDKAEAKYRELFGDGGSAFDHSDPEFMAILKRLIFGEVFENGALDDATPELNTVTLLAGAALTIGVEPVAIREAVYQCAPFIGFPRTLNAIGTMNEVLRARGIALPLPAQGTTTEADRFARGQAAMAPLYGDGIRAAHQGLPEALRDAMPDFLVAHCFGDFYTRGGLTLAQRELLLLCLLAALGDVVPQLQAHGAGAMKAGNSRERLIAALIHSFPYIGLPRALNAIRVLTQLPA